jgi:hypothetical protein
MKSSEAPQSLIELLCEKNFYLEKFYSLNETQLEHIEARRFDGLETFYRTRDGILDIILKIDEMVDSSYDIPKSSAEIDQSLREEVIECLNIKNNLVTKILEQDLKILSAIEVAKTHVIKELAQVRGAKKAIGAYKSGPADRSVDEEA